MNKSGTIAGVRIEMGRSVGTALSDGELLITLTHKLSDENLKAQHEKILSDIDRMGIELSTEQTSEIYGVMYRVLELQNEIGDFGAQVSLKFLISVDFLQKVSNQ